MGGDILKRSLIILLIIAIISSFSLSFGENAITGAEAHILLDYDSMTVLDGKEIHKPLFPASTTKVMTAILALEHGNLDDIVTVDQEVVDLTYGSHIALEPGEEMTLRDMLYALLVTSANDSALAIAKHISGSIDEFVQLMNEKAKELGALNTNFVNPHGLHDDNHVTTAYDLALIARYAMENPIFRDYVNTTEHTIEATEVKGEPRYLYTTNRLLRSGQTIDIDGKKVPITYEGAQGVKTGYTEQASNCLISYAEKDGQNLLAVVLKCKQSSVYVDTHKLLNYGFDNFDNMTIANKNEFVGNIEVPNGNVSLIGGILEEDVIQPMNVGHLDNLDRKINLRSNLEAPVSQGEIIGTMEFYSGDDIIAQANILSTMDVELAATSSLMDTIIDKWYLVAIALLVVLRIVFMIFRRKSRRRRSKSLYV